MAETVTATMARGYEVMQRQSVRYDYEKVFWNGTFTVGLVGLGWVAVKLGQTIAGLQGSVPVKLWKAVTDADAADYYQYQGLFDMVEGKDKLKAAPNTGFGSIVSYYRANLTEWDAYVEALLAKHPDWVVDESGKPTEQEKPAEKVLNYADSIFTKYGAAMPLAAVVGHVVLEYARVHKLRRDLV
jgi:hypothetical protein